MHCAFVVNTLGRAAGIGTQRPHESDPKSIVVCVQKAGQVINVVRRLRGWRASASYALRLSTREGSERGYSYEALSTLNSESAT